MEQALAAAGAPEHPIDLLTVDLMFTQLVYVSPENRRKVTAGIYRRRGHLEGATDSEELFANMTDDAIMNVVGRMRKRFAGIEEDEAYWDIVNQYAFEEMLGDDGQRRQHANVFGKRTHKTIISAPELYRTLQEVTDLLIWVRTAGVRVVVLSNQLTASAQKLIRHFGLEELFCDVYTSERLGVRKPYPETWHKVLELESKRAGRKIAPERTAHLGNSLNSDVGAARLGIPVLLYDREGDLLRFTQGNRQNIDIPEQTPEELLGWMDEGLVTIHGCVDSIREHLSHRIALRVAA